MRRLGRERESERGRKSRKITRKTWRMMCEEDKIGDEDGKGENRGMMGTAPHALGE